MTKFWWIMQKDIICEFRAWRVWPRVIGLGLSVAFLLSYQLAEPGVSVRSIAGSLCWITICIAGVLTLGESLAVERENGCWEGLLHYPLERSAIYLAKFIVNAMALAALQCVVVPFFLYTTRVTAVDWSLLLLVMLLGNLGISAVGTVVGVLATGTRQGHGFLALLLLPLWVPIVLAASKATSLIMLGESGSELWRWTQFLLGCVVIYVAAGFMLFEFAIEE